MTNTQIRNSVYKTSRPYSRARHIANIIGFGLLMLAVIAIGFWLAI